MHTIQIKLDETNKSLVIESDEEGLTELKEMIEHKLRLKGNISQAIIAKDLRGEEIRLKFELIPEIKTKCQEH